MRSACFRTSTPNVALPASDARRRAAAMLINIGSPPPGSSPTIPPSGQPTVVVETGGSIVDAVRAAAPGSTVIVAPGAYATFTLTAADVQGSVTILADTSGALTNSS